jgi:PIN domain nuclease of toxin-antitoxin system
MVKIPRNEVPELPDRIIAATATLLAVPLISRDRTIRASSVKTVW